ncbi:stage V sporulation protein AE [Parageobacillus thermantarcticus]|uniref:Stage V sporulation protein AE n=1 Tax=Parageobacillus thermantarcticus TaxID=186116 RepID=A0A1I0T8I5_9BACL|nr:SpoVA/SpoVAEb family sporulation membrane protein [Parageobacillus thermantarcticus]SFA48017.1 stage V sporulation protein AE [Parageobacillus thermantarcticus]
MDYVVAFIVGGALCAIAQLVMDIGKFSQMHVMGLFVATGVFLGISGIYDRLIAVAGAGAVLPISGFGYFLAKGVLAQNEVNGWLAIGSGMFQFAGAILSFAVVLSFFTALLCKPKG